ncbi:hypothetical protein V6N13_015788 [Hibiscus sabdariffa]|uniref:Uncharacterized protein n=1 Tax=Hibiscus sabdariffa TaxID=183260 RepID=A0ABR2CWQ2_9ROSI
MNFGCRLSPDRFRQLDYVGSAFLVAKIPRREFSWKKVQCEDNQVPWQFLAQSLVLQANQAQHGMSRSPTPYNNFRSTPGDLNNPSLSVVSHSNDQSKLEFSAVNQTLSYEITFASDDMASSGIASKRSGSTEWSDRVHHARSQSHRC